METKAHPRRNIAAALLALLALLGITGIATMALFSDNATIKTDAKTGTLEISVGGKSVYDLDEINQTVFAPTVSVSEVVEVANTGSVRPLDATVDISSSFAVDPDLAKHLYVEVEEVADASGAPLSGGPNVVFAQAPLDTLKIDGLEVDKDQSRFLKFTVTMPDSGDDAKDNELQGRQVAITLTALAKQRL